MSIIFNKDYLNKTDKLNLITPFDTRFQKKLLLSGSNFTEALPSLDYKADKFGLGGPNSLISRVFRRPPRQKGYEVDKLASFAVLGLDLKITPGGKIEIIEVNGINSGMKGFDIAGVRYTSSNIVDLFQQALRVNELAESEIMRTLLNEIQNIGNKSCEAALERHLKNLGAAPLSYIAAKLSERGINHNRIENLEPIIDLGQHTSYTGALLSAIAKSGSGSFISILLSEMDSQWHAKYGKLAETLIGIELVLSNKLLSDRCFEGCREIKGVTYPYTVENLRRIAEAAPYVVLKPTSGARGEGLYIVSANIADSELPKEVNEGYVAEAFIKSKPILSETDGKMHDGCMRYVVVVEENRNCDIKIYHFGGYWRLAPKPLSGKLEVDELRANLAQGALAEKVSKPDLLLVKNTVDRYIPIFYRNLINESRKLG